VGLVVAADAGALRFGEAPARRSEDFHFRVRSGRSGSCAGGRQSGRLGLSLKIPGDWRPGSTQSGRVRRGLQMPVQAA
jgi:hypothetical protein